MQTQPDYYAVLGVSSRASHGEIKKAFRAQVFVCHPDRGGSPSRMRRINEAWAVLGDAELRREYDRERTLTGLGVETTRPVMRPPVAGRQRSAKRTSYLVLLIKWVAFGAGRAIRLLVDIVSGLLAKKT